MNAIPSVPTDNLYKFCAVAGGIALIISGLILFQAWRDVLGRQWLIEQRANDLSSDALDIKIAEAGFDPAWIPDGADTPEGRALRGELKKKADQLKRTYGEAEKKLIAERQVLASAKHDFTIIGFGTASVALLGIAIGIYGFRKWRIIQRKQDQLLDLEIRKRGRDLEGPT